MEILITTVGIFWCLVLIGIGVALDKARNRDIELLIETLRIQNEQLKQYAETLKQ